MWETKSTTSGGDLYGKKELYTYAGIFASNSSNDQGGKDAVRNCRALRFKDKSAIKGLELLILARRIKSEGNGILPC